ncbi:trigger factor-like isoform X1 [Bombus pyrosoma]|uniref:trigger factor-like isoform X1 n=1 Tax=Bombus pyrosoma TaxID=396416 RepID=UPI001CB967AD|nr:trigger factor-like isoform X1 [Bombus pyrosoma]
MTTVMVMVVHDDDNDDDDDDDDDDGDDGDDDDGTHCGTHTMNSIFLRFSICHRIYEKYKSIVCKNIQNKAPREISI